MRGVTDGSSAHKADHLRRLVFHARALGYGERERTVLPDEHFEAARGVVSFSEPQELRPSPG